jgi:hypothetical protein
MVGHKEVNERKWFSRGITCCPGAVQEVEVVPQGVV